MGDCVPICLSRRFGDCPQLQHKFSSEKLWEELPRGRFEDLFNILHYPCGWQDMLTNLSLPSLKDIGSPLYVKWTIKGCWSQGFLGSSRGVSSSSMRHQYYLRYFYAHLQCRCILADWVYCSLSFDSSRSIAHYSHRHHKTSLLLVPWLLIRWT